MTTKKQLYDICQGKISMSSIGNYSDENVIMGKYGMISFMDDYWDIWVTGVHLGKILSGKRVRSIGRRLKTLSRNADEKYEKEMTAQCMDENLIWRLAVLLGAKKKRQISEETKQRQIENLRRYRNEKS